jgi:hypothetical protein
MCFSGSTPNTAPPPSPNPPVSAQPPCPQSQTPRKLLTIQWNQAEGWCSETVAASGTTQNWTDGETVAINVVYANPGTPVTNFSEPVRGNSFSHNWQILEVLPPQKSGHYVEEQPVNAEAEGKVSPAPLKLKFVPTLPKTHYASGNARFDLSALDYEIKIESDIEFVKGWAAEVVLLGTSVPSATGGSSWQNLPSGFSLNDSNNLCVGFYKSGSSYVCQYGGNWPENFTDWNISAKQAKIDKWRDTINSTWTGKFPIKRKECRSSAGACCKYSVKTEVKFTEKATFAAGTLIIADGNIRSNSGLFFLDDPDEPTPAHEFGHHLGNPDEYAGATSLDTSLNSDGAVNGVDDDSIMGLNMTRVKKRHFRTVCTHFASMVQTKTGKSYTYEAV